MKSIIVVLLSLIRLVGAVAAADAGPVAPGVWYEFSFLGGVMAATGCSPADPDGLFCCPSVGTPTIFADALRWTFTAPAEGATLRVQDAFDLNDQLQVFDFDVSLGVTSRPPGEGFCGTSVANCILLGASRGTHLLGAGDHSITIQLVAGAGRARFVRWDRGHDPIAVPNPGAGLFALVGIAGALARGWRRGQGPVTRRFLLSDHR